jgi:hypothetical protein
MKKRSVTTRNGMNAGLDDEPSASVETTGILRENEPANPRGGREVDRDRRMDQGMDQEMMMIDLMID